MLSIRSWSINFIVSSYITESLLKPHTETMEVFPWKTQSELLIWRRSRMRGRMWRKSSEGGALTELTPVKIPFEKN
jgi:hypothetical protein